MRSAGHLARAEVQRRSMSFRPMKAGSGLMVKCQQAEVRHAPPEHGQHQIQEVGRAVPLSRFCQLHSSQRICHADPSQPRTSEPTDSSTTKCHVFGSFLNARAHQPQGRRTLLTTH